MQNHVMQHQIEDFKSSGRRTILDLWHLIGHLRTYWL